jgi:hypothetical protein
MNSATTSFIKMGGIYIVLLIGIPEIRTMNLVAMLPPTHR